MPSFFNGKRFFLTYPRTEFSKEELVEFLKSKGDITDYVVAREEHADGGFHLHACVEFSKHQRHAVNWLDFNGRHPNKQDPRKWEACKTYCKKDGDFLEAPRDASGSRDFSVDFTTLCLTFESEESWMSYCCSEKISFQYAVWCWGRMRGDMSTIETDEHPGKLCPSLEQFECTWEDKKTLILKGKSGCGKTTWAKRNIPKPCLFVTHIDELKSFRAGYHVSIIFDDVDFNHYPRTSQIAIVDYDNPRQIHCRHAVARIPAGVVKVFTCNADPVGLCDEAVRRRCRVVNVHE